MQTECPHCRGHQLFKDIDSIACLECGCRMPLGPFHQCLSCLDKEKCKAVSWVFAEEGECPVYTKAGGRVCGD